MSSLSAKSPKPSMAPSPANRKRPLMVHECCLLQQLDTSTFVARRDKSFFPPYPQLHVPSPKTLKPPKDCPAYTPPNKNSKPGLAYSVGLASPPPTPSTMNNQEMITVSGEMETYLAGLTPTEKYCLIRTIFNEELLTIQRPEPLVPFEEEDDLVILQPGVENKKKPGKPEPSQSQPPKVVDLISSDEEDVKNKKDKKGKTGKPDVIDLVSSDNEKPTDNVLVVPDDSDEEEAPPKTAPGPADAPRLDFTEIREALGFTNPDFDFYFKRKFDYAFENHFTGDASKRGDVEAMLGNPEWKRILANANKKGQQLLYSGFPMVETVVFVAHPNSWGGIDSGNCYWTAMALMIYGTPHAWLRVKAEHLYYLEAVLKNKDHVRHDFYKRQNAITSHTYATPHKLSQTGETWQGGVNLWERLQIPNCWTSDEMCALTADVYGIFLVMYSFRTQRSKDGKYEANTCYDLRTYGAFNNRHLFFAYKDGCHFVPLVPNSMYHYEFRFPRISLESSDGYSYLRTNNSLHKTPKDGIQHVWRCSPNTMPAPLSYPRFEKRHLYTVVGYSRPHAAPTVPILSSPPVVVREEPPKEPKPGNVETFSVHDDVATPTTPQPPAIEAARRQESRKRIFNFPEGVSTPKMFGTHPGPDSEFPSEVIDVVRGRRRPPSPFTPAFPDGRPPTTPAYKPHKTSTTTKPWNNKISTTAIPLPNIPGLKSPSTVPGPARPPKRPAPRSNESEVTNPNKRIKIEDDVRRTPEPPRSEEDKEGMDWTPTPNVPPVATVPKPTPPKPPVGSSSFFNRHRFLPPTTTATPPSHQSPFPSFMTVPFNTPRTNPTQTSTQPSQPRQSPTTAFKPGSDSGSGSGSGGKQVSFTNKDEDTPYNPIKEEEDSEEDLRIFHNMPPPTVTKPKPPKIQDPSYKPPRDEEEESSDSENTPLFQRVKPGSQQTKPKPPRAEDPDPEWKPPKDEEESSASSDDSLPSIDKLYARRKKEKEKARSEPVVQHNPNPNESFSKAPTSYQKPIYVPDSDEETPRPAAAAARYTKAEFIVKSLDGEVMEPPVKPTRAAKRRFEEYQSGSEYED